MTATLPAPPLVHVCNLTVELGAVMEMGAGPAGVRRIIPIIGGTVDGPKLSGNVLNVGADWQTVLSNGAADLNTRYALQTHDGAVIEMTLTSHLELKLISFSEGEFGRCIDGRSTCGWCCPEF